MEDVNLIQDHDGTTQWRLEPEGKTTARWWVLWINGEHSSIIAQELRRNNRGVTLRNNRIAGGRLEFTLKPSNWTFKTVKHGDY